MTFNGLPRIDELGYEAASVLLRACQATKKFIRSKKENGEVSFPTQVRCDAYYFYSAAYCYSGSAEIIAPLVPLSKKPHKNNGLSVFWVLTRSLGG